MISTENISKYLFSFSIENDTLYYMAIGCAYVSHESLDTFVYDQICPVFILRNTKYKNRHIMVFDSFSQRSPSKLVEELLNHLNKKYKLKSEILKVSNNTYITTYFTITFNEYIFPYIEGGNPSICFNYWFRETGNIKFSAIEYKKLASKHIDIIMNGYMHFCENIKRLTKSELVVANFAKLKYFKPPNLKYLNIPLVRYYNWCGYSNPNSLNYPESKKLVRFT